MATKSMKQWSAFEMATKVGLEALGYNVTHDVLVSGSQIDMVGEYSHHLHTNRMLVECKDYNKEIGIKAVREFAALVDVVSTKQKPYSGILVSRIGFTKEARAFATEANILLLTLSDLLKHSFDPMPIVKHVVNSFERDELRQVYVDLNGQVTETGTSTIYKPVEKFFDTYFSSTKRPGIALLGNFGSGKTSLCKHYAYLVARHWEDSTGSDSGAPADSHFLPIYVDLRHLSGLTDLEGEILRFIKTTFHLNVTDQGWRLWLQNRSTLLFLDGFDEMAVKMDKFQINAAISGLKQFTSTYRVKVILACRTHFFKSQVEEQELGNMLKLYLRDWGQEELTEYVSKALPDNTGAALDVIHTTYNLEELAQTPLFLNMITATIQDIEAINSNVRVNRSRLYRVYTDRWMQSQDYRSRLSPVQKEMFMKELAFTMFTSGQLRIHHRVLPETIGEVFRVREYESLLELDKDIRTCSFLTRDLPGYYQFIHKSFMEYFVAFKLAEEVKSNSFDNFSRQRLSIEVATFFSDYFEDDTDILMRSLLGNSSIVTRENCAVILGLLHFSEPVFQALSLAVKTDKCLSVQQLSVDSLASFNHKDAISVLIDLSADKSQMGLYCLKSLGNSMCDPDVLELHRDILRSLQCGERIVLALQNIAQSNCTAFFVEMRNLANESLWEVDEGIGTALVSAIQAAADLDLAALLDNMSKSKFVSHALLELIDQAKQDLRIRFRSEVERQAEAHKSSGESRSRNRALLKKKYGYLCDEAALEQIMSRLYPPPPRKRIRAGARGRQKG